MSVLVLTNRDVKNGKYIEAYLTDFFAPDNMSYQTEDNIVYKCYIPFTGKTARVPEMSRYFFYNNLKTRNIDKIYLSSVACSNFIDENISEIEFYKNGYFFEKTYLKTESNTNEIFDNNNDVALNTTFC